MPPGSSDWALLRELEPRCVWYYHLALQVHVTTTEAACISRLRSVLLHTYAWSTKILRGICHGVRLQATRCIQIPEQHNNTWLNGESGPGVQLSEGCSKVPFLHTPEKYTGSMV